MLSTSYNIFFYIFRSKQKTVIPQYQKILFSQLWFYLKNINFHLGVNRKNSTNLTPKNFYGDARNKILGLTSTKQKISSRMVGQTDEIGPKLFCSQVTFVDIKMRLISLDAHVLGKYPRGSCQYKVIINHEHENVAIFQNGINNLERTFNNGLLPMKRSISTRNTSITNNSQKIVFKNIRS